MLTARRAAGVAFLIALFVVVGRFLMLGADFPPVSASVSEYGDMGYCLQNVRARVLEGAWRFDRTSVSLGSPLHSLFVYAAVSAGGMSGAMVTLVSALAFLLLWSVAAARWLRTLPAPFALAGLALLAAQHLLFAYSFSWKQEMLMVSLSVLGLLALDLEGRRGAAISGLILSLAFLTKMSAAGACVAALAALLAETCPGREKTARIAAWSGSFLVLPVLSIALARVFFEPAAWEQLSGWLGLVVSGRVGAAASFHDRIFNLFRMNLPVRSLPELAFGLALSVPALRRPDTPRALRALTVLALVHLTGPLLALHYPLRWALPAAAAGVFLAVEGAVRFAWRGRASALVAALVVAQAAGYVMTRFDPSASLASVLAVAFVNGAIAAALLSAWNPSPRRFFLVILLLAACLHAFASVRWILGRSFRQEELSRAIEAKVIEFGGGAVRPMSFIGWQSIWPTSIPTGPGPGAPLRFLLWDSTGPAAVEPVPASAQPVLDSEIEAVKLRVVLYRLAGDENGVPGAPVNRTDTGAKP